MSNPFNTHEEIDYELKLIEKYTEMAYKELTQ